MPMLTIKTKDGKVHRGCYPIHAIMVVEMGIEPDDVADKGIVVKGGRTIWMKTNKL